MRRIHMNRAGDRAAQPPTLHGFSTGAWDGRTLVVTTTNLNSPFVECVQTIFPVDGLATPVTPGTVIPFAVPDMHGRPWAQIWEKHWEQGMEMPQQTGD